MKKTIVLALGGNALGNDLPGQMAAVKTTSVVIADLIAQGYRVVVTHGNGPQGGMITGAFEACQQNRSQITGSADVSLCGTEPGIYRLRFAERTA